MEQLSKVSRILWIAFAAIFAVRLLTGLIVACSSPFGSVYVLGVALNAAVLFFLYGGLLTWFIFFLIQTGGPKSREWLPALLGVASSGMLTLAAFIGFFMSSSTIAYSVWIVLNVMVLMAAFILLGIFFKEKIQKWVSFIAAGAIPVWALLTAILAYIFGQMGAYSLMSAPGLVTDILLFAPFFLFVYVFDANKPKALPKF